MKNHLRQLWWIGAGCAGILAPGCSHNGGKPTTVTIGGGPTPAAASTAEKTASELTLDEGQKLLAEIRKDPKRLQKLTPQEKRFLGKAMLADNERKKRAGE